MTSTSITFECAAFAEVIKRADKLTPKKGEALDKAAGIVLDIDPSAEWGVKVRATNLDVYYTEWVTHMGATGDKTTWRVASSMLMQMVTKLPIGTGKTVTLANKDGLLTITSGRFKAAIGLMDPEFYPVWDAFNPQGTAPVADLGARLEQVSWATAGDAPGEAISGIRFNGETLAATDKYKLVTVPCNAPHIGREVVVPASIIAPLIKQMGDTNVGIVGNFLVFMPNEYTQIKVIIYDTKYPPVERLMSRDYPHRIKVEKSQLVDSINRVVTADSKNRMPSIRMFFGMQELAVFMEDQHGRDKAIDTIELPGQADHERHEVFVSPRFLLDALAAAPNARIELGYDPSNKMRFLYLDGGSGFESWIVPRAGAQPAPTPDGES